jgi:hypothetical protein|tara:strand:- start:134 stop:361 length:228 start_codon:yes stop_codon:yes gene_type:complete
VHSTSFDGIINHTPGKEPPVKTTAAQSEINNLTKKNSDLLIARINVAATCNADLFVLLTAAIVVNERRIKELHAA